MSSFTAFLNANVLHPAELRSFLMYLAVSEVFRARWSNDVLDWTQPEAIPRCLPPSLRIMRLIFSAASIAGFEKNVGWPRDPYVKSWEQEDTHQ